MNPVCYRLCFPVPASRPVRFRPLHPPAAIFATARRPAPTPGNPLLHGAGIPRHWRTTGLSSTRPHARIEARRTGGFHPGCEADRPRTGQGAAHTPPRHGILPPGQRRVPPTGPSARDTASQAPGRTCVPASGARSEAGRARIAPPGPGLPRRLRSCPDRSGSGEPTLRGYRDPPRSAPIQDQRSHKPQLLAACHSAPNVTTPRVTWRIHEGSRATRMCGLARKSRRTLNGRDRKRARFVFAAREARSGKHCR